MWRENLKSFLGIIIMFVGIGFGICLSLWLLVGGITQIVNAVQAQVVSGISIGWGIIKILAAWPAVWFCIAIGSWLGRPLL